MSSSDPARGCMILPAAKHWWGKLSQNKWRCQQQTYVFGDTYFYNRVGVAIFVVTAHGKYMIGGVGGVGWGGIIASMYACGTSWCYVDGMFLHTGSSTLCYVVGTGGVGWGGIIASMYACGTSWCYVDEMLPIAWWWSPWSTCVVNGLGRCECGEERKLQEPNKLIVVGNISKKMPQSNEEPHWPNNQC